MNWTAKPRIGAATAAGAARAKPGPAPATVLSPNHRISNGLKEFLWQIGDVPRGRVLDLGPAYQATISFFLDRNYRLSSEDLLRAWKEYVTAEEERSRAASAGEGSGELSPAQLTSRFLASSLQYPEASFHGVLAWDLLDYFDPAVVPQVVNRLSGLVHPGGAVLAQFHSRPADRFHRYRIVDAQSIELVSAATIAVHSHVFQNREILDLFPDFRSSRTFVGRDQVREALFIK